MRAFASYLAAGILVVLALDLFVPPAGIGLTVNARSVLPSGATLQYVDRSGKGDRLDVSVTTIDKRPVLQKPAKIMDGCDPAFSPLSAAAGSNFPGRCAA